MVFQRVRDGYGERGRVRGLGARGRGRGSGDKGRGTRDGGRGMRDEGIGQRTRSRGLVNGMLEDVPEFCPFTAKFFKLDPFDLKVL